MQSCPSHRKKSTALSRWLALNRYVCFLYIWWNYTVCVIRGKHNIVTLLWNKPDWCLNSLVPVLPLPQVVCTAEKRWRKKVLCLLQREKKFCLQHTHTLQPNFVCLQNGSVWTTKFSLPECVCLSLELGLAGTRTLTPVTFSFRHWAI